MKRSLSIRAAADTPNSQGGGGFGDKLRRKCADSEDPRVGGIVGIWRHRPIIPRAHGKWMAFWQRGRRGPRTSGNGHIEKSSHLFPLGHPPTQGRISLYPAHTKPNFIGPDVDGI